MKLRDGRQVTIRAARVPDGKELQAVEAAIVRADRGVIQEVGDIRPPDQVRARIARFVYLDDLLLVALIDGVVVASIDVARIPVPSLRHNAELTMGVAPPAQGVGLGRLLVEAALAWCDAQGIDRITLYCLAANQRALALYESVGFRRVHLRTGFVRRADGRVMDDWHMEWTRG